ncbi:MAG: hypothetical protein IKO30_04640 [Lachnospiraceae bacterium]|nr:hypothetical protein [Lachnospiraceae bacterium]
MKKTKKLFATVLSLALATTMLSACSTGSSENESTPKPTEATTQTQVATEKPSNTEETTATVAPSSSEEPAVTTEPQQSEDGIIPLFPSDVDAQIHGGIELEDIAKFEKYCELCNATDTGILHESRDNLGKFILWTTEYLSDREFVIRTHPEITPETAVTVKISLEQLRYEDYEFYVIDDPKDIICLCLLEVGGETYREQVGIAPLYYDQTKQCLIVITLVGQEYQLREFYVDGKGGIRHKKVDDPSRYGF